MSIKVLSIDERIETNEIALNNASIQTLKFFAVLLSNCFITIDYLITSNSIKIAQQR